MLTFKDVIPLLSRLSERKLYELYSTLLPRAMDTNPMREWTIKVNPTVEDVAELVKMLPPDDCEDIYDLYIAGN